MDFFLSIQKSDWEIGDRYRWLLTTTAGYCPITKHWKEVRYPIKVFSVYKYKEKKACKAVAIKFARKHNFIVIGYKAE